MRQQSPRVVASVALAVGPRTASVGGDGEGVALELEAYCYDGSDGTDINACDVSKSRRHVVCADDFGGVSLLNYPCIVEDAPCAVGRGHSSHVSVTSPATASMASSSDTCA